MHFWRKVLLNRERPPANHHKENENAQDFQDLAVSVTKCVRHIKAVLCQ